MKPLSWNGSSCHQGELLWNYGHIILLKRKYLKIIDFRVITFSQKLLTFFFTILFPALIERSTNCT